MTDKYNSDRLLSEDQIKEKMQEAAKFETGTLADEIIISQSKNRNYNPNDIRYDAEPEFLEERNVTPKGTGKNYQEAVKLYKEIETDLTNKQTLSMQNSSAFTGKAQQDATAKEVELHQRIIGIKDKIRPLETAIDQNTFKPKIDKLLSGYRELLEYYEEKVKNKYGNDFFDKDDVKAMTLMSEKVKYDNEPNTNKDPGPLLLWSATSNMIRSLEKTKKDVNQEDLHKPFGNKINAWAALYKGEDGKIIKADRGDLAVRIGNEIARILNFLVTLDYKKEFEFFKSRGKEQQENKVQQVIDLPKSIKP
jgi:hypothetical protein